MVGARLVEARPQGHQEMLYLLDLIRRQSITTVHFVPSMLQVFLEDLKEEQLVSVRQLMMSSARWVRIPSTVRLRFPGEGSSALG